MNKNEKISSEQDSRFGLIVTGLLVVIIVALAGLWMMERKRRCNAETALDDLQVSSREKMQSMGNMLVQQMTQASHMAVDRDQLATQRVNWNGRDRSVLLLSASRGEKLGFQPGDVILITPSPATQPATEKQTEKE
jgi:hypothetical protein